MLADPALMGTNPNIVWISVDFPAPFGPSRPMVRPESWTRRSWRISRLPKRTLRPASSITGSILIYCVLLRSQGQRFHQRANGRTQSQARQGVQAHARDAVAAAHQDLIGGAVS